MKSKYFKVSLVIYKFFFESRDALGKTKQTTEKSTLDFGYINLNKINIV